MRRLRLALLGAAVFYAGYLRGVFAGETDALDRDCGCEDEERYPLRGLFRDVILPDGEISDVVTVRRSMTDDELWEAALSNDPDFFRIEPGETITRDGVDFPVGGDWSGIVPPRQSGPEVWRRGPNDVWRLQSEPDGFVGDLLRDAAEIQDRRQSEPDARPTIEDDTED